MSPLSIVSLGLEQSTALPTTALRSAVNDSMEDPLSLSQRRRRRKDREDDRVDDENEEDDNGRASGGKRHARIGWNRPATEKGTQGGPPMHAELRPLPASLFPSLSRSLPSSTLPEPHPGYRPRPQRAGMRVMLVAHMMRGAFEYPSLLSIAISISFERST